MPFSDMPLNRKILEDPEELIEGSDEKECQRYSSLFFSRATNTSFWGSYM